MNQTTESRKEKLLRVIQIWNQALQTAEQDKKIQIEKHLYEMRVELKAIQ